MDQERSSLRPFAYLNAEKTRLYRALMGLFMVAKTHFEIHLRPAEVLEGLDSLQRASQDAASEVEAALVQLCDWGNLKRTQDTSDVRTVEEFHRPRFLYQLTREGEAAERAVQLYEEQILKPGELQSAALGVIREQLQALLGYAQVREIDAKKVHLTLSTLKNYFDQLTSKAQVFIGSIQRAIDLHGIELEVFIAYKEKLIDYLERFIGELVIASDDISNIILTLERTGVAALLRAAAEHDLVDAIDSSPDKIAMAEKEWKFRWAGLKKWFVRTPESPSQADTLRTCARSAIPALLLAISGFHDRRLASSDRPTDLKLLARWFAQVETNDDAHRLWRAAFALNPSRHLRIDDDTLAVRDQRPIPATASWIEAEPMLISPRLRRTGQHHRRGRPANVIDRSHDKKHLAELARLEAEQIERARRTLAANQVVRLSELAELNRSEFQLLLDLLGKALAEQKHPDAEIITMSSDGSLRISMRASQDGSFATIVTPDGEFHGRDYYVCISDLASGDPPAETHTTAGDRVGELLAAEVAT